MLQIAPYIWLVCLIFWAQKSRVLIKLERLDKQHIVPMITCDKHSLKTQILNLRCLHQRIVVCRASFAQDRVPKVILERRAREGESPVYGGAVEGKICAQRVGLYGIAAQNGW